MAHRRALAHQCPSCRRHWALQIVRHPSGTVVICQYCSAVRAVSSGPGLGRVAGGA